MVGATWWATLPLRPFMDSEPEPDARVMRPAPAPAPAPKSPIRLAPLSDFEGMAIPGLEDPKGSQVTGDVTWKWPELPSSSSNSV